MIGTSYRRKKKDNMNWQKEYEQQKKMNEEIIMDNEILAKENKMLTEEVTKLKRKVKGHETTISNLNKKLENYYKSITF